MQKIKKVQLPLSTNRVKGSIIILVLFAILFARALMMSHIHPMLVLAEKVTQVNVIEHSDKNLSSLSHLQKTSHFDYYLDARSKYIGLMDGKNLYEATRTHDGYSILYRLANDYVHYYYQGDIHFRDWYARELGAATYDHQEYTMRASYQQQNGLFKDIVANYELSILDQVGSFYYINLSFTLGLISMILVAGLLMFSVRVFFKGSWGEIARVVIGTLPISLMLASLIPYQVISDFSIYHAAEILSPRPFMFIILTYLLSLLILLGIIERENRKKFID